MAPIFLRTNFTLHRSGSSIWLSPFLFTSPSTKTHSLLIVLSTDHTCPYLPNRKKKKDSWKLLLSEIEIRSFLFPCIISSNLFLFNYIWAIDFCMLKLCPAMLFSHLFVSSSCSIDLCFSYRHIIYK